MHLVWSKTLSTGVAQLDDEHQTLIRELNRLGDHVRASTLDAKQTQDFMQFLGTYTAKHFHHEEKCMHEARCPMAQQNKDAHREFIRLFVEAKLKLAAGASTAEAVVLHARLCEWVQSHIMKIDTQLHRCASSHAA